MMLISWIILTIAVIFSFVVAIFLGPSLATAPTEDEWKWLLGQYFGTLKRRNEHQMKERAVEVKELLLSVQEYQCAQFLLRIFEDAQAVDRLPPMLDNPRDPRFIEINNMIRSVILVLQVKLDLEFEATKTKRGKHDESVANRR